MVSRVSEFELTNPEHNALPFAHFLALACVVYLYASWTWKQQLGLALHAHRVVLKVESQDNSCMTFQVPGFRWRLESLS